MNKVSFGKYAFDTLIVAAVVGVIAFIGLGLSKTSFAAGKQNRAELPPRMRNTAKPEIIGIDETNSVIMDDVFDENSASRVMQELQVISNKLSTSAPIYLIMNTPGGSVDAGLKLIAFAKALPQRVITITMFAASMGFQTVQQLDDRLLLPGATLMSHPVSFGVQGQTPYQIYNRTNWIMQIADGMDMVAAERMGMKFHAYQDLVHDEYWTTGQFAVNDKAADRVVLARCGRYTSPTRTKTFNTMFGLIEVTLHSCPLIPGIVSIKMAQGTPEEALNYVKTLVNDKAAFTRNYILNNKYVEFQR